MTLGGSRVVLYPLFHPAAALYTPRMLEVLETDFGRLPGAARPDGRAAAPGRVRAGAGAAGRRAAPARAVLTQRVVVSASPEETASLGAHLATRLEPGDVVTVAGGLGTGKTTFVRGACRALGVTEPVASPTYTIGHRYEGRVPVAHLDLYRLSAAGADDWGDLEPYFDGTIAFVEWPEHAGEWLDPVRAAVHLEHVDESHRRITVESDDDLRV